MAHLGPETVSRKFAGMVKRCADCGFDLAAGRVEVVPTAHYFMGGVVVDTDARTALPGLYVAGEDAGGAHGANRLGGNGVANSTVYGGIAGDVMGHDFASQTSLREPDEAVLSTEIERAMFPVGKRGGNIHELRRALQDAMWDDVGVIRTAAGMTRALDRLDEIDAALMATGVSGEQLAFNLTWHDWLNMRSLVDISKVITHAGLARENSRGAHYREDFPEVGELESSYFTRAMMADDDVEVTRAPVAFTIVRPGETILPEGEPDTLVAAAE